MIQRTVGWNCSIKQSLPTNGGRCALLKSKLFEEICNFHVGLLEVKYRLNMELQP